MSKSTVTVSKLFENEEGFLRNKQNNAYMQANVKRGLAIYVVDALIQKCLLNDDFEQLTLLNNTFVPVKLHKRVKLSNDVYCEVQNLELCSDNSTKVTFQISSDKLSCAELAVWLEKLHERYIDSLENELGKGLFYFNQITRTNSRYHGAHGMLSDPLSGAEIKRSMLQNAYKHLSFSKNVFFSNKSFSNLYGKNMRKIEARLNHFLDHPEWYHQRGIPHQLTILLSGPPGTGKSSVVRAIANRAQRHIVNVAFHSIQTATQLKNLTFNQYIEIFTDDDNQKDVTKFKIPLDKRITVYDEVDASSPLVRDRKNSSHISTNHPEHDELTLADVLQAFEGSVEVPGCIRVVNTNYPELLDKAFRRPGRIDLNIVFDNSDSNEIAGIMFEKFFERHMSEELKARIEHLCMTPVEINDVFFNHFGETDDSVIIDDLLCVNKLMKSERNRENEERANELSRLKEKIESPVEPEPTKITQQNFAPNNSSYTSHLSGVN